MRARLFALALGLLALAVGCDEDRNEGDGYVLKMDGLQVWFPVQPELENRNPDGGRPFKRAKAASGGDLYAVAWTKHAADDPASSAERIDEVMAGFQPKPGGRIVNDAPIQLQGYDGTVRVIQELGGVAEARTYVAGDWTIHVLVASPGTGLSQNGQRFLDSLQLPARK